MLFWILELYWFQKGAIEVDYTCTRASQVPGILVNKSSTGTPRVPLELCVLIISHFLAFSWTIPCLSYFLDYVDKDKCMFKNTGVSVLYTVKKEPTKFQSALINTLPAVSVIGCAHTSWREFPKYVLWHGMRPHTNSIPCNRVWNRVERFKTAPVLTAWLKPVKTWF